MKQLEPGYTVADGMATLGPEWVRIRRLLEERFERWAMACRADSILFPPLMRVRDLSDIDYFKNFPHLATAAARIRRDKLDSEFARKESVHEIAGEHLDASGFVLPSAACYNIYLHLRGKTLVEAASVTTVANCFRNEDEYDGLRRLWGFTMREIVRIGTVEDVEEHLNAFKGRISLFLNQLGLPFELKPATDPFFQPSNPKAQMQQLFPTKEEFVYGGSLAFASLNFHRNFFGERCKITASDGKAAYTGCVAFGIERWLHALLDHFKEPAAVVEALTDDSRRPAFVNR